MIEPSLKTVAAHADKLDLDLVVSEYNLIQEKKCRLPARQRQLITALVAKYWDEGKIKIEHGMASKAASTEASLQAKQV